MYYFWQPFWLQTQLKLIDSVFFSIASVVWELLCLLSDRDSKECEDIQRSLWFKDTMYCLAHIFFYKHLIWHNLILTLNWLWLSPECMCNHIVLLNWAVCTLAKMRNFVPVGRIFKLRDIPLILNGSISSWAFWNGTKLFSFWCEFIP